ncbi:nuclear transport factor 2 family protein [Longimicrobium sp.]|uniref:YybH family protein n=1 Tax=Longimicrobium sp. TaxID=2029185 RepID=UPI002EDA7CFE
MNIFCHPRQHPFVRRLKAGSAPICAVSGAFWKAFGVVMLAMLPSCAPAAVQPAVTGKSPAEAEREVRRLEEVEWARAVQQKDTAWFQRHLADELVATTGRTGRVTTKAQEMAGILSSTGGGADRVTELRVQPYGDVAVATFRLETSGSDDTGPYTRTARYTEVWHFRDGRWQLVASHSSLIPPP